MLLHSFAPLAKHCSFLPPCPPSSPSPLSARTPSLRPLPCPAPLQREWRRQATQQRQQHLRRISSATNSVSGDPSCLAQQQQQESASPSEEGILASPFPAHHPSSLFHSSPSAGRIGFPRLLPLPSAALSASACASALGASQLQAALVAAASQRQLLRLSPGWSQRHSCPTPHLHSTAARSGHAAPWKCRRSSSSSSSSFSPQASRHVVVALGAAPGAAASALPGVGQGAHAESIAGHGIVLGRPKQVHGGAHGSSTQSPVGLTLSPSSPSSSPEEPPQPHPLTHTHALPSPPLSSLSLKHCGPALSSSSSSSSFTSSRSSSPFPSPCPSPTSPSSLASAFRSLGVAASLAADGGTAAAAADDAQEWAHKRESEYTVIRVAGDGRCLFSAVLHGVCVLMGVPVPKSHIQRCALADQLRLRVTEEFVKRRKECEWFLEGCFEEYVENMKRPHVWGGEPELLMLSHVLRYPITVFILDPKNEGDEECIIPIAEYGKDYSFPAFEADEGGLSGSKLSTSENPERRPPIAVLYNGYNHYDALLVCSASA